MEGRINGRVHCPKVGLHNNDLRFKTGIPRHELRTDDDLQTWAQHMGFELSSEVHSTQELSRRSGLFSSLHSHTQSAASLVCSWSVVFLQLPWEWSYPGVYFWYHSLPADISGLCSLIRQTLLNSDLQNRAEGRGEGGGGGEKSASKWTLFSLRGATDLPRQH